VIKLPAMLLPSSSAINGLVRVGQLGAPLSDVRPQFLTLWALALSYGTIAIVLEARKNRQIVRTESDEAHA
jgi:ABC-2 type transport system permease protein